MKANKENYSKIKDIYIPHQFKLIDSILEALDKMEVNDAGSNAFYNILDAHIVSLCFRLQGYVKIFKEVFDEDITIPEKYQNYIHMAQDYIYLDAKDSLMIYNIKTPNDPKPVFELIELAKKKKSESK